MPITAKLVHGNVVLIQNGYVLAKATRKETAVVLKLKPSTNGQRAQRLLKIAKAALSAS